MSNNKILMYAVVGMNWKLRICELDCSDIFLWIVQYLKQKISWPFDELQGLQDTSPYVEINNMELAATKLKEFADDYTLNTNKPMDLVFFKASVPALHVFHCRLWIIGMNTEWHMNFIELFLIYTRIIQCNNGGFR